MSSTTTTSGTTAILDENTSELIASVALGVFGNLVNAVGYIIQKLAHIENARRPKHMQRPFLCNGTIYKHICIYNYKNKIICCILRVYITNHVSPFSLGVVVLINTCKHI